jgi:hypothetical protein
VYHKAIFEIICTLKYKEGSNTFLFPSIYILGIGLMMATQQYLKHVTDLLNSKIVFWLENLQLQFTYFKLMHGGSVMAVRDKFMAGYSTFLCTLL